MADCLACEAGYECNEKGIGYLDAPLYKTTYNITACEQEKNDELNYIEGEDSTLI